MSDEANDHLFAFGMNHMDFLFSIFAIFIFHENTRLCSEPRPEDNQCQKKSTKVRESSQARYLREEHLSRKDHRFWVQNQVLVPAL